MVKCNSNLNEKSSSWLMYIYSLVLNAFTNAYLNKNMGDFIRYNSAAAWH